MKIKTLWIVTKPTPASTMKDICFQTTLTGLHNQFNGGLEPEDIFDAYTEEKEARSTARWLLDKQEDGG